MENYNDCSNDFINAVDVLSLIIGIKNYEENLNQNDKQEIMNGLNRKTDDALEEIHQHLKIQDEKLDKILKLLDNRSDDNGNSYS